MKATLIPAVALLAACAGRSSNAWHMPSLPRGVPAPSWADSSHDLGEADAVQIDDGALPPAARGRSRAGIWLHDEADAWKEAKRRGRPLLVDFSAEWCVPCMRFQEGTFGDETVQAEIARSFVPLRIDVTEETQGGREQLRRYRIRGLPAVVLVDPSGRELGRLERYLDEQAFLAWLSSAGRADHPKAPAHPTSASASAASADSGTDPLSTGQAVRLGPRPGD